MKVKRQIFVATMAMVALFAFYEWLKTVLFPDLSSIRSHVTSTIVVGIISAIVARAVINRQSRLLSEQKSSNEKLRETLIEAESATNLLQSILISVDEGLLIIDRNHQIILVNDAALSLFNLGKGDYRRLSDISQDPVIAEAFLSVLTKGERASCRVVIRTGIHERVLRLLTSPLRQNQDIVGGVVGAFIDITQIERLESIRQAFLANVSHELRTPLTSITAYTETLLDGGLEDAANAEKFLNTIHRNAERMRNLVNDISELSLIESGAVRLSFEPIRLRAVVNEVFTGLRPGSEKYQVRLVNDVPDDYIVVADHRRIEQILTNLIDNGIKFNRVDGEVRVSAELQNGMTFVHVKDTGVGIPPEHLNRVFERLYRVDKARSREMGGTGLGLAIVKHLTRAHGGDAEVKSEPGKGCEFTIKLPTRQPPTG